MLRFFYDKNMPEKKKGAMFGESCTRIQLDIYHQIYRHVEYINWCETVGETYMSPRKNLEVSS